MAGFLSMYNTPERLIVADGYWVDVKQTLTTEEYANSQRVLLGKLSLDDGKISTEPDTIAYQFELVSSSIVDWNLTDEDGVLLPLSPPEAKVASIKKLPQSVFVMLYERVNEVVKPRSKDDEISFRPDGQGSADGNG